MRPIKEELEEEEEIRIEENAIDHVRKRKLVVWGGGLFAHL